MTEVVIKIKSTCSGDGVADVSENTYNGRFEQKDGKHYIMYDECESIGAAGVHTLIKADGNRSVVMQRTGSVSSRICVEPGTRNRCAYPAAGGQIELFFSGETINNLLDSSRMLTMCYTIESGGANISRNTVEISIEEV